MAEQAAVNTLVARIFQSSLGAVDLVALYLGDRLGWYQSLADDGPADADQLAERTGSNARYAREWLEQQAASSMLELREVDGARRFAMSDAAREVLTDRSSLNYLAPLARMIVAGTTQMPALLQAYRSGGGVGWRDFGADARESQADMNRPWYEHRLAPALAQVQPLNDLLSAPGVRIADIGCGGGWSTIALAGAYPAASVRGYDLDEPSIALARANAEASGSTASFVLSNGADLPVDAFDAVFAFECIHDMPDPVGVLAAAHRALVPGGSVIVMDEAVADALNGPADEVEQLMYGFSLLICLPDGMAHASTRATGTVMRPEVLRSYAWDAGFAGLEVLPIEDFGLWRFYQLS